ncbi:MAG: tetratricopeptide repeat protein [Bacteroidota bacterium]
MKRFGLFIMALMMLITASANNLADSARQAYTNESYAIAADLYKQMLEQRGPDARLYYNLGNAYYKLGDLGPAILNYERAARLNPTDDDIQHNLTVAREQIQDDIDAIPELFFIAWLDTFNHWLKLRTWAVLSIIFFFIFIAFTAWRLFRKRSGARTALSSIAITALFLSIICLLLAFRLDKQRHTGNEAIVFEDGLVKSSPSETGINLFEIHEGLKVEISDSLNSYTQITLSDGSKGWIRSNKLQRISLQKSSE